MFGMFCNIFIFSFNTLGIIVFMNFVIGMNLVNRNGINRNFIHDNKRKNYIFEKGLGKEP